MDYSTPWAASRLAGLLFVAAQTLGAGPALAQQAPDLSGVWQLNREISDDPVARIEQSAGPEYLKGGGMEADRLLPRGGGGGEVDRIRFREWLIDRAGELETLTIEQTSKELKVFGAEQSVRIFYFGRDTLRQTDFGPRLTSRVRAEGERLVVEESAKDGPKLVQVFTPVPGGQRLNVAWRMESPLFVQPLELKLSYNRVQPE